MGLFSNSNSTVTVTSTPSGVKTEFFVRNDPEKASRIAQMQAKFGNDVKVTDESGKTPGGGDPMIVPWPPG